MAPVVYTANNNRPCEQSPEQLGGIFGGISRAASNFIFIKQCHYVAIRILVGPPLSLYIKQLYLDHLATFSRRSEPPMNKGIEPSQELV